MPPVLSTPTITLLIAHSFPFIPLNFLSCYYKERLFPAAYFVQRKKILQKNHYVFSVISIPCIQAASAPVFSSVYTNSLYPVLNELYSLFYM